MGEPLTDEQLDELLENFRDTAFRMETRRQYALSYERAVYERFLAGEEPPPATQIDWWRPWLDWVGQLTAQGRRLQRVRVLDDPPTDYQRFSLWGGRWNVQAGEQISYLARATAAELGIPAAQDWWLFDAVTLVVVRFGAADDLAGQELVTDPQVVARYRRWRDLAITRSRPAENVAAA
jgi:hypothetical protein